FLSPFNLCLRNENLFGRDNVILELEQKKKALKYKAANNGNFIELFAEELAYLLPERIYGYYSSDKLPNPVEDTYKLADLYMLGLLGFELLTGKTPPTFQDFEQLKHDSTSAYQEITEELISRSDIPQAFQEAILKIIKKDPYDRQEAYCKFEDAIRTFKRINYYLSLAQESYKSCLSHYGSGFEQKFIETFLEHLKFHESQEDYYSAACKKKTKREQPAHMQLSFKNKHGVVDDKKMIKHAKTLKESILFLFAYFEQSEHFIEQEPNILTRVAESHRNKHEVPSRFYAPFKKALIDTMVALDSEISHLDRSLSVEVAWKHVVEVGFDYMTNHGSKL
ncbi:MAG: hypothetical protein F6J97_18990, partial [Leptolyngbya sp. SIO4C1]|nr:hypothetical protein [Leptolyngbya sp. SIO4C1]